MTQPMVSIAESIPSIIASSSSSSSSSSATGTVVPRPRLLPTASTSSVTFAATTTSYANLHHPSLSTATTAVLDPEDGQQEQQQQQQYLLQQRRHDIHSNSNRNRNDLSLHPPSTATAPSLGATMRIPGSYSPNAQQQPQQQPPPPRSPMMSVSSPHPSVVAPFDDSYNTQFHQQSSSLNNHNLNHPSTNQYHDQNHNLENNNNPYNHNNNNKVNQQHQQMYVTISSPTKILLLQLATTSSTILFTVLPVLIKAGGEPSWGKWYTWQDVCRFIEPFVSGTLHYILFYSSDLMRPGWLPDGYERMEEFPQDGTRRIQSQEQVRGGGDLVHGYDYSGIRTSATNLGSTNNNNNNNNNIANVRQRHRQQYTDLQESRARQQQQWNNRDSGNGADEEEDQEVGEEQEMSSQPTSTTLPVTPQRQDSTQGLLADDGSMSTWKQQTMSSSSTKSVSKYHQEPAVGQVNKDVNLDSSTPLVLGSEQELEQGQQQSQQQQQQQQPSVHVHHHHHSQTHRRHQQQHHHHHHHNQPQTYDDLLRKHTAVNSQYPDLVRTTTKRTIALQSIHRSPGYRSGLSLFFTFFLMVYLAGASIHTAAAFFKETISIFLDNHSQGIGLSTHPPTDGDGLLSQELATELKQGYLLMQDTWEHFVSHYMYAFGALGMSWCEMFAYAQQRLPESVNLAQLGTRVIEEPSEKQQNRYHDDEDEEEEVDDEDEEEGYRVPVVFNNHGHTGGTFSSVAKINIPLNDNNSPHGSVRSQWTSLDHQQDHLRQQQQQHEGQQQQQQQQPQGNEQVSQSPQNTRKVIRFKKGSSKRLVVLWLLCALFYGGILAGVSVQYPKGIYVGLTYIFILVTVLSGYIFATGGGLFSLGRRYILQSYLFAALIAMAIIIIYAAIGGFTMLTSNDKAHIGNMRPPVPVQT